MRQCTAETKRKTRCKQPATADSGDLQLCWQHYDMAYADAVHDPLMRPPEPGYIDGLTKKQCDLLNTVRRMFPTSWFHATDVKSNIRLMKSLEQAGYVESSVHNGTLSFRLKRYDKS